MKHLTLILPLLCIILASCSGKKTSVNVETNAEQITSGAEFGKKQLKRLEDVLLRDTYRVTGKSTFKEEFVTAGGVDLSEINIEKFESKRQPSLFMVGEILNIDAITGGFNFQAAWTGAHIAATGMSQTLKKIHAAKDF